MATLMDHRAEILPAFMVACTASSGTPTMIEASRQLISSPFDLHLEAQTSSSISMETVQSIPLISSNSDCDLVGVFESPIDGRADARQHPPAQHDVNVSVEWYERERHAT